MVSFLLRVFALHDPLNSLPAHSATFVKDAGIPNIEA